jgi:RNA polymerase sigma-70 factor (ECF subfamily)
MPHDQNISSSLISRFEKIYEATYFKLYGFAKYYVWSEDAVKDVLQECYIRLWENLPAVKDDEKIMPLLRRYVITITIDAVRKKAKEFERATVFHSQQSPAATADESLNMRETIRLYREAVDALPPRQRDVFILTREKGLSQQEISEQLNISTHTIKRHMGEALQTLRTKFPAETLSLLFLLVHGK